MKNDFLKMFYVKKLFSLEDGHTLDYTIFLKTYLD